MADYIKIEQSERLVSVIDVANNCAPFECTEIILGGGQAVLIPIDTFPDDIVEKVVKAVKNGLHVEFSQLPRCKQRGLSLTSSDVAIDNSVL